MRICSCVQLGFCVCVCACTWSFKCVEPTGIILFQGFQIQTWHFLSVPSRSLAGLKEHWAEAKPTVISGNVSTGTDLYRVGLISAFRRLILMSILRQMLPGFLCWHRIHLGLTIFIPKAPLKYKDAWSVCKKASETAFGPSKHISTCKWKPD